MTNSNIPCANASFPKNNESAAKLHDLLKDKLLDADAFINAKEIGTDLTYKHKIVWPNAIGLTILHLLGVWGFFVLITGGVGLKSFIWTVTVLFICSQGVTVGAHRYYTHRCFKATPFLRAIFLLAHNMAGENTMFTWTRDHRLHHRYSDTDGDPHNAKRGFFFSHIGWIMHRKHPYVKLLGRRIDMSDLQADWMVMFQKKYFYFIYFVFSFFIPTWVPVHFFGETWRNSFLVCYIFRYVFQLNGTWLVNSAAHIYGTRPYDKNLQPVDSWFVSVFSAGEGWHNYHHTFPWDYKAAELSELINPSAKVIKFLEKLGLAYDLKTASPEQVRNRILKTGDGTHWEFGTEEGRARVRAIGPLHPLNPTYTVTYPPPAATLTQQGLPLYHDNDVFGKENIERELTSIKNSRKFASG